MSSRNGETAQQRKCLTLEPENMGWNAQIHVKPDVLSQTKLYFSHAWVVWC